MRRHAIGFVSNEDRGVSLPDGALFEPLAENVRLVTLPASMVDTPRRRLIAGLDLHAAGCALVPIAPRQAFSPSAAAELASRHHAALRRLLDLAAGHDEITLTAELSRDGQRRDACGPPGLGTRSGRSWLKSRAESLRSDAAREDLAMRFVETLLSPFSPQASRVRIRGGRLVAAALVPRHTTAAQLVAADGGSVPADLPFASPVFIGPWPPYSFAVLERSS